MSTPLTGIPKLPNSLSKELQTYLRAITDNLEIRLGLRGESLDRAITVRELTEAGILSKAEASRFRPHEVTESNRGFNNLLSIPSEQKRTIISPNEAGTIGEFAWDDVYFYVCVAKNTWKRIFLSAGTSSTQWAAAPSITSGSTAGSIAENSGAGQVVYIATASEPVTFTLQASGDHAHFSIQSNYTTAGVVLTANPDFETKSSYTFTVIATDIVGTGTATKTVTLAITDVSE